VLVPVVVLLVLLAGLLQPSAARPVAPHFALTGATSTAPTPPDLYVAYSPLPVGTSPGADTVQAFTSGTSPLQSIGQLASVGAQPVAEATSPDGGTVYVLNSGSDNLTPVDALNQQSETPIPLQATATLQGDYNPVALAITPNGQDAWVASEPTSANTSLPAELIEVSLTGTPPGTIAQTINLPSGSSPSAVAITPNGLEALVADYNQGAVTPVNLQTGKVGSNIDVGLSGGGSSPEPQSIAVSPNGQDAYVADFGDGTLTQIALSNNSVSPVPLETGYNPVQVAVSPDGSTAWVTEDSASSPSSAGFVVPVAIPTMTVGSPIAVGLNPDGVAITPDGSTVYVANETNAANGTNSNEGSISVVPTSGSASVQTTYVNIDPAAVVVTPDEAPVASFTETVAPAGQYTVFDASASYSLTSGGLEYSWNFGDGSAVTVICKVPEGSRVGRERHRVGGPVGGLQLRC